MENLNSFKKISKILILLLQLQLILFIPSFVIGSEASYSMMYQTYAIYYDQFYQSKDYAKEVCFLDQILSEHQVKTILDVGCGTGTHLSKLENCGYTCLGIDFNLEMLALAKTKLNGKVRQADMRSFDLMVQFDAIISMFAVFNHNLEIKDAKSTLAQLKKHLNPGGILILDLYNPQSSGKKVDHYKHVTRIMEWQLDQETDICHSHIKFIEGDAIYEETFPLKIYSMQVIEELLSKAGFKTILFFDNYTFQEGTPFSKNLIVVAK